MLQSILEAQEGKERVSYKSALGEIQRGGKTSHWIWYVWPCLQSLRPGTSRPHYLLPDMDAAEAYLRHEVLCMRLEEITRAAVKHLTKGMRPSVLFGSATDASKFAETMTFFSVAAASLGDVERLRLFAEALRLSNQDLLDERTMALVVGEYGRPQFRHARKASELLASLGGEPRQELPQPS